MTEDDYFSFLPNPMSGKGSADAQSAPDEIEKVQAPPTLSIKNTSNRFLVGNSIHLIITTALISAIGSWSHPVSWFIFAAMVLKFVASIGVVYATYSLILSEHGVRLRKRCFIRWEDLIDFAWSQKYQASLPRSW